MKLKTILTKKQICARMTDPPMGGFIGAAAILL
jgi:hypothetical protein